MYNKNMSKCFASSNSTILLVIENGTQNGNGYKTNARNTYSNNPQPSTYKYLKPLVILLTLDRQITGENNSSTARSTPYLVTLTDGQLRSLSVINRICQLRLHSNRVQSDRMPKAIHTPLNQRDFSTFLILAASKAADRHSYLMVAMHTPPGLYGLLMLCSQQNTTGSVR